jgi:uncharacterized membrane protein YcaP (DUF421 family)
MLADVVGQGPVMAEWFEFTVNPLELIVRGTIIYIGLILCVRFLLRRDVGSMGMADFLFIVLIADAAQNGMAGEYKSLGDAMVLIGTIVFLNILIDWVAYRNESFRRFVEPRAVPLIKDGKWVRANLKKEWITTDEVLSKLREQGIDGLSGVAAAYLESNGELGVIRADRSPEPQAPKNRHRAA